MRWLRLGQTTVGETIGAWFFTLAFIGTFTALGLAAAGVIR